MASLYEDALAAFKEKDWDRTFGLINEAMTSPEAANPSVFALLGDALVEIGQPDSAAEAYEEAGRRPGPYMLVHQKRAIGLHMTAGNEERAFLLALQYQKTRPDDADINHLIVTGLLARGESDLVALFQNRLVASDNPEHLRLAAKLIGDDNRNPHNLELFRKMSAAKPDDPFTRFKYYSVAREFCDFAVLEEADRWIRGELRKGHVAIFEGETPYSNLLHCPDEVFNRMATNNRDLLVPPPAGLAEQRRARPHQWSDKIRIGYLSNDFWDDHATMRLFQSVLEKHDRTRFEVTLYCYTPEKHVAFDGGNRARWGRIVRIEAMDDAAAAAAIRADGCDILIDLKGHTGASRSRILNEMVAPVQVAWLGFPGSVVNVDVDYVIGDPIVLPDSSRPHYHEKFCRLPDSYQPNDPVHRPLPPATPRWQLGLPDDAFVFASFNANRKISLPTIDLWIEIMRSTEQSVLWIMADNAQARDNITARMMRQGVGPDRLIFTEKTDYANHVARLQAADLCLDTFPYNGHTTTSDALWAGVPVLTQKGSNFASRVSESLLAAAGLPELVAPSAEALFSMAVQFCREPATLAGLRARLALNRASLPLFDADRFVAHLETAYTMMAERARAGLAPDHFDVPVAIRQRAVA